MKPYELKAGDRFRVADACDRAETIDTYQVVDINVKTLKLSNDREITVSVMLNVFIVGHENTGPVPLIIGPWVEISQVQV